MNSKILFVAIIFILAVGFVLLQGINTISPGFEPGWHKICSSFNHEAYFLNECEQNDFNIKYKDTPDYRYIADAPIGYFDSNGNHVQYCGGYTTPDIYQQNLEKCTALEKLDCSKKITCSYFENAGTRI